VQALVIFRHAFGMDRASVAALPIWEREVLFSAGKHIMGLGEQEPSVPGLSSSEVAAILGG
jgi:hypothetical protein